MERRYEQMDWFLFALLVAPEVVAVELEEKIAFVWVMRMQKVVVTRTAAQEVATGKENSEPDSTLVR